MSMTQLAIVFLAAFTLVSFLLFTDIIRDSLKRLRKRPEQPHVILGDDLRGRTARVLSVSEDGQHIRVGIGSECWQGRVLHPRRRKAGTSMVSIGDKVVINKVDGLTLYVLPKGE